MANAGSADKGRKLRARGPIRVSLPAAVAYDPDRLKKSLGNILDQIGCRACCSGADIFLEMERNYLVGDDADVTPLKGVSNELHGSFEGVARLAGGFERPHQVTVGLARNVKFDIDRVFQAVDRVIDILGPHPCISGFDVLLKDELRTIVIDEQFEAQRF